VTQIEIAPPGTAGTPIGGRPPWSASPEEMAVFIDRVATPYDPDKDNYRDPGPFARDVKAGKNTAIYNAHSYHTKVPPKGIVPYLEHYTDPGDLVLDPFCGSGMTGVACLMTGRNAILNDLSPAATHIAYNYVTPVNVDALKREFNRIKAAVADEFEWLYGTTCDRCGGPAIIQYTIWSDVFACKACNRDILLWDVAVVRERQGEGYFPPPSGQAGALVHLRPITPDDVPPKRGEGGSLVRREAGDVLEDFRCLECGTESRKTQLRLIRSVPVVTNYECGRCRPSRAEHSATDAESARMRDIGKNPLPYEVPDAPFGPDREMWRRGHSDASITRVRDFWTKRNLWALASWWSASSSGPDARLVSALRFVITSTFGGSARTTRYRFGRAGSGAIAGTLYVPSFSVESNFQRLLNRKFDDVISALDELAPWCTAQPHSILLTVHGGQSLGLVESSVDYIFTDPPFGANIFYSDVSLLWEAWLGYLTNQEFEAVWNRSNRTSRTGKTLEDYKRLMFESFAEMHRVLKPGRWASVVFHNSDDRVWHAIREAALEAGFDLANAVSFDKEQRTFKGIKGEKGEENVTNFDIVLNLQKPTSTLGRLKSTATAQRPVNVDFADGEMPLDVEEAVVAAIEEHLRKLPVIPNGQESMKDTTPVREQRTTQFIHSLVMQRLLPNGRPLRNVSYGAIATILKELFKQVDGRWYLPGDEVRSGRLDDMVFDEVTAIEWLRRVIKTQGPQVYGDLAPLFRIASVQVKLSRTLDELLEENFHFDERRGRWRLPTTAELEANRQVVHQARARRIRRFLAGEGDGPHDPSGLADWAEESHRLGLFQEARQLFSRIIRGDIPEERYRRLTKLSRVWSMRSNTGGGSSTFAQSELPLGSIERE